MLYKVVKSVYSKVQGKQALGKGDLISVLSRSISSAPPPLYFLRIRGKIPSLFLFLGGGDETQTFSQPLKENSELALRAFRGDT